MLTETEFDHDPFRRYDPSDKISKFKKAPHCSNNAYLLFNLRILKAKHMKS